MAKHTIGPWAFREAFTNGEPCGFAIEAGRTPIADVTTLDADDYEIDKGNSRLISAAPDLLAACERALADASEPDGVVHVKVLEAMQSAIAKAKGATA